jgi:hypothetical protein
MSISFITLSHLLLKVKSSNLQQWNNVSQEKLNGLTILSIEQDLLDNIEYKILISNFQ